MEKIAMHRHEMNVAESKGPWVYELHPGQEFIGFYVARNPNLTAYRDETKGKYMRLQLVDRSGKIQARVWHDVEEANRLITDGGVIKVDGLVDSYQEQRQVQIRRFRLARDEEIQRCDLLDASGRDPEEMWTAVQEKIRKIRNPYLRSLLRYLYTDLSLIARFLEMPAARVIHHAYMHGLLEHVYELLVLSESLVDLYPEIDRDLLITGILLHDIGKLDEYDFGYDISVTDSGKLIGHVISSTRMVSRAIDSIVGFPEKLENQVLHLIVSHHGRREWGAARRPKSLEAIALHHLDNLDAQVNRFKLLLRPAKLNGNTWTEYDRMLGRMLYAGIDHGLSLEELSFLK